MNLTNDRERWDLTGSVTRGVLVSVGTRCTRSHTQYRNCPSTSQASGSTVFKRRRAHDELSVIVACGTHAQFLQFSKLFITEEHLS